MLGSLCGNEPNEAQQVFFSSLRFILVKHQQSLLSATKEFLGKKSDIIRLRKELGCAAEVYSASQSCTELNNSPVISSTMDSVVPGNVLRCILQSKYDRLRFSLVYLWD